MKLRPDWLHLTLIREGFWFEILAGNQDEHFSFQPDSYQLQMMETMTLGFFPPLGVWEAHAQGAVRQLIESRAQQPWEVMIRVRF